MRDPKSLSALGILEAVPGAQLTVCALKHGGDAMSNARGFKSLKKHRDRKLRKKRRSRRVKGYVKGDHFDFPHSKEMRKIRWVPI
jgi:hypothetical protein